MRQVTIGHVLGCETFLALELQNGSTLIRGLEIDSVHVMRGLFEGGRRYLLLCCIHYYIN